MKEFFRLLLANFVKAIIIISVIAIYVVPMYYIVTSGINPYKIGLFLFIWLVIWIVLLITVLQCIKTKNE